MDESRDFTALFGKEEGGVFRRLYHKPVCIQATTKFRTGTQFQISNILPPFFPHQAGWGKSGNIFGRINNDIWAGFTQMELPCFYVLIIPHKNAFCIFSDEFLSHRLVASSSSICRQTQYGTFPNIGRKKNQIFSLLFE
jgi:hypothetical protein